MKDINEIMDLPPYSLNKEEKNQYYEDALQQLTQHHYSHCEEYKRMLDNFSYQVEQKNPVEDIPFLPVRLFKEYQLCSVAKEDIVKTMTSSGTSGQQVSKIFLDKTTSGNQTKALVKITSDFLGKQRLPMLVLDSKKVIRDRKLFSARGAGILGFSMLGHHVTYGLDDDMNLDIPVIEEFLEQYKDTPIFLFGFTYMVWEHLYKTLKNTGKTLDLSQGILFHGGGFKKLEAEAVDNEQYKEALFQVCGIKKVYNYYGMVEQTGSIFMECECGNLHASNFSDIIIRNPKDFSVAKIGEPGLIQLVSLLPESYPGHSILSEDMGQITGQDNCPCGRKGKTFQIFGRIKNAEIRGCSDTYEKK